MNKINAIIKVMRPTHWIKNLVILIPAFFGGTLHNLLVFKSLLISSLLFSLLASAIYVINDIVDCEDDAQHPAKCKRPIAAQQLSKKEAIFIGAFLLILVGLGIFYYKMAIAYLYFAYLSLNLLYTFYLKKIPLIDVCLVSIMFLIRLFIGGEDVSVLVSKWLLLVIFFVAMIFSLGKRRDDLILAEITQNTSRSSIKGLNIELVNYIILLFLVLGLNSYIMYCTVGTPYQNHDYALFFTIIGAIIIAIRYLQVMFIDKNTGSPVKLLLNDTIIIVAVLMILAIYLKIIYWV